MRIIFFHGKLSNPETSHTAKAVKEYFNNLGYEVYVPDYKPNDRDFEGIVNYLDGFLGEFRTIEETVFIGISLGGFWALNCANKTPNSSCILLNPSLGYYGFNNYPKAGLPVSLFVNMDDELINSQRTIDYLFGRALIETFPVGGHRMTNIEEIMPRISKAVHSTEV